MDKDTLMDVWQKIGTHILDGLSEEESAMLCDISIDKFREMKNNLPSFSNFLDKKKIEFKQRQLRIVASKADRHTAQWLLEKIFPMQFGTIKKQEASPLDLFALIIKDVQKHSEGPVQSGYTLVHGTTRGEADTSKVDGRPRSITEILI